MRTPRPAAAMAPLAAGVVAYAFLPAGLPRDVGYDLIGLASVSVAFCGLRHLPPRRRRNVLLVLAGFLGWVVGDALFTVQDRVGVTAYPAPADAVYIASYGLIGLGLLGMVRRRGSHSDAAAVLDAAILATGVAIVAGVFVIAPAASDSTLSLAGKLTSSLYPVADVLLLGIVVRLWATPGSHTVAFRLLVSALSVTLVGDLVYNLRVVVTGDSDSWVLNDVLWLAGYVLVAGSVWAPSVRELTEPAPGHEDPVNPRRRLVVLTGGLLLPGVTLLANGLGGVRIVWPVIAGGSILLSMLVLSRMAGLLAVVSAQSVRLAALARTDPLTGLANRRTWDHELSRACHAARDRDTPLTVALLDLDLFKDYNDTFGHPAGDRLLREATAIWSGLLQGPELLSRYGGEEFAVLFPGQVPTQAVGRLREMLAHTPAGQTFSAGVAAWDPSTDPTAAVAAADRVLYEAKRGGRNQVRVAEEVSPAAAPVPRIVLQPIVDLDTRRPVAVEALSRFPDQAPAGHTTESVFDDAHRSGRGPDLEAAAITAARRVHPPGLLLSVNLALEAFTSPLVREALAGDLTGVIIEVTERSDASESEALTAVIADYRSRGAILAVDDWGTGYSTVARLLLLQPELVKIDISIVRACASAHHGAAIKALTAWARTVDARICAEGIETEAQRTRLLELGVHLGQGYLFGHPIECSPTTNAGTVAGPAGLSRHDSVLPSGALPG